MKKGTDFFLMPLRQGIPFPVFPQQGETVALIKFGDNPEAANYLVARRIKSIMNHMGMVTNKLHIYIFA